MRGKKISKQLTIIGLIATQVVASTFVLSGDAYARGVQKSKFTEDEILNYDFKCPKPKDREYDRRGGFVGRAYSTAKIMAPPPVGLPAPLPPPPPPPPPSVAPAAESVVVTGTSAPNMPNPYAFPGQPNTEAYPHSTINPVKSVATEPTSTFAMETDSAAYANARRMLNEGTLPGKDQVRVEEFLNYFKYDYKGTDSTDAPFATNVAVVPSPWNKDKQIIHIGLQGYNKINAERPPLNLVLLLDVSGSMSDEDKLPLVKKSIRTLLPQLDSRDRVSIVVYAGAAGVVLNPTKGNETRNIVCSMENLQAGGSTAGGEGIELAYKLAQQNFNKDGVNRIVIMTDGDFNVGIYDPSRLKDLVAKKRETGIYLSTFGFGGGNYDDETMQSLAQNGNGIAAYIDNLQEAKKVFHDDFSANMFPIANDVKTQVEFNPKRVSEWRLVGYETRLLNREDFNNDKVDAGEIGAGHQVTAIYEITPTGAKTANDPLRYQNEAQVTPSKDGEIAFLRLRYKLPGQNTSKLIERPISNKDVYSSLNAAPSSTKFALAVASFGQKLRSDPWIGDFDYGDIRALSKSSGERDDFGLKAEFEGLVAKALVLAKGK